MADKMWVVYLEPARRYTGSTILPHDCVRLNVGSPGFVERDLIFQRIWKACLVRGYMRVGG